LDACALIALIKLERGADKIESLLNEAVTEQVDVCMHTVNLIEVHYCFYRTLGKEKSALILEKIHKMPIRFIDTIDEVIFSETSRLKAQYAIPLGDSIGLATAVKLDGSFVTADHSDFGKIEQAESIPFLWFR
jgi:PIN domain nuclease of toxin-antitoxin system